MKESGKLHTSIYKGYVSHTRYRPAQNSFTYNVLMMYLDLDELEHIFSLSWLWSIEKYNVVSFFRKDYLGNRSTPLKQAVQNYIEQGTGIKLEGRVCLLTNLRYLGHITNPISCYYCFDDMDNLRFIIAEVTNTPWGERQPYIIPVDNQNIFNRHVFSKEMYVSPFMPMSVDYHWQNSAPESSLSLSILCKENQSRLLSTHLNLQRYPLTSKALTLIALTRSMMTIKISLATHWQAIRLLLKKVPLVSKKTNQPQHFPKEAVDEVQRNTLH